MLRPLKIHDRVEILHELAIAARTEPVSLFRSFRFEDQPTIIGEDKPFVESSVN